MNRIPKASFVAALILLLSGGTSQTYGQRCGGDVKYILRNERGETVNTEKVVLKFMRKIPGPHGIPVTYAGDQIRSESLDDRIWRLRIEERLLLPDEGDERVDSIKVFQIHTGCGMHLVEVALEYESRVMSLRFHNIPEELNFFVDSLPFREGTFEIDFKGDMGLKGQKLDREGVRNKEGKYVALLRDTAQAGRLVSAKNWIRTSSKKWRI
jgi:hypothetical protein